MGGKKWMINGKPAMKILSVPLAIALFLFFMLIPMGPDVAREAQNCIAVFFFFIILFVFEPIPMGLSCIFVLPMITVLKIGNSSSFLTAGLQSSIFTILCSFVLAAAMLKSRLGERVTLAVISRFGFSTVGITLGIVVVNIILNFTTSAMVGRYVILSPIVIAIIDACKAENAPESSKFAKNLMLTMIVTNLTMSGATYTATPLVAQTMGMLESYGFATYDYMEYLKAAAPIALVVTFVAWAVIQIIFKPDKSDISDMADKEVITGRLKALGKTTPDEWKTGIITILAVAGWIWGGKLGLDVPTVTVLAAFLLTMPYIGFLTWKDWLEKINWYMIFVICGSVALGGFLYSTGAADVIGNFIYTILGIDKMGYAVGLLVFMLIINFMHVLFVGTSPYLTSIVPIGMGLCLSTGWHPGMLAIAIVYLSLAGAYILFCSNTTTLMSMSTGKVEANDYMKVGIPLVAIGSVIVWAAMMFYWPALGIFA